MTDLHALSLEPPDGADAAAAVVAIHGRGASADDLVAVAEMLELPGVRWVFPQGWQPLPHPLGMGWAWFELPPRHVPGIHESRRRLTSLLDEVTGRVPAGRTALAGFSQGAVMALDVGLRYPKRLAGVASLSGYLFEPAAVPAELAPPQATTPVFLAHGTMDDVVPLAGTRHAAQVLRQAGVPVELHEYPMAHQITGEELADLREFLVRALALPGA